MFLNSGPRIQAELAVRLAFAFCLVALTPNARASLFAVDSGVDELRDVDPGNGATTLVGGTSSGGLGTPAGLAWDGSAMYTIDLDDGQVFTLDLLTGAPTLVGTSGISGWQGIAARPGDGALFAINQSNTFYSINKSTGAATVIAGGVGSLITALEFDPFGILWGIEFGSGAFGTIDPLTGIFASAGTTNTGFQGLTFDGSGTAYASNTSTDSLYTVNLTTGTATLVGSMNGTGFVKGLAFDEVTATVPEPGALTLFSLGLAGVLFGARQRRHP